MRKRLYGLPQTESQQRRKVNEISRVHRDAHVKKTEEIGRANDRKGGEQAETSRPK